MSAFDAILHQAKIIYEDLNKFKLILDGVEIQGLDNFIIDETLGNDTVLTLSIPLWKLEIDKDTLKYRPNTKIIT